jgi:N-acetylglucosamine malate deacetylase 1
MIDILAIGAHPDDVELACSGTLLHHAAMGHTFAIVDLTAGELGTRGTAETRAAEAAESAQILGAKERLNLGLKDGFFLPDEESLRKNHIGQCHRRPTPRPWQRSRLYQQSLLSFWFA